MTKEEGLYQNKVSFSHVCTCNCKIDHLQINEKSKIWHSVSLEDRKGSKKFSSLTKQKTVDRSELILKRNMKFSTRDSTKPLPWYHFKKEWAKWVTKNTINSYQSVYNSVKIIRNAKYVTLQLVLVTLHSSNFFLLCSRLNVKFH